MKLIVLVGPAGAGKTTYTKNILEKDHSFNRVSQDDLGKKHLDHFKLLIENKQNIIVDRMGFNKQQRDRYIKPAKEAGYQVEIVVFHVPRYTCFERIMARENHPTINGYNAYPELKGATYGEETKKHLEQATLKKKSEQANSALDTFFTKYERVEDSEADKVTRLGWVEDTHKTKPAIICDLDSTLCNIDHRLRHMKHEKKKDNRWDLFFKEIPNDTINEWCKTIIGYLGVHHPIILCSGRPDSSRKDTEENLIKNDVKPVRDYRHLFMRHRSDFRRDDVIKEVILEFEIKTRYKILFAIDDRSQVVKLWRKHGLVCLQCDVGDF